MSYKFYRNLDHEGSISIYLGDRTSYPVVWVSGNKYWRWETQEFALEHGVLLDPLTSLDVFTLYEFLGNFVTKDRPSFAKPLLDYLDETYT